MAVPVGLSPQIDSSAAICTSKLAPALFTSISATELQPLALVTVTEYGPGAKLTILVFWRSPVLQTTL